MRHRPGIMETHSIEVRIRNTWSLGSPWRFRWSWVCPQCLTSCFCGLVLLAVWRAKPYNKLSFSLANTKCCEIFYRFALFSPTPVLIQGQFTSTFINIFQSYPFLAFSFPSIALLSIAGHSLKKFHTPKWIYCFSLFL